MPVFKKEGSNDTYYISLVNLGDFLLHQNKLDEAQKLIEDGVAGLASFPNTEYQLHAGERLAALNFKKGNFSKAGTYYREAFNKAVATGSPRLIFYIVEFANFMKAQNDIDGLKGLYARIAEISNINEYLNISSLEDKKRYYLAIAHIFEVNGDYKSSSDAYKMANLASDSLSKQYDLNSARELQTKYQIELQKKENELLSKENSIQKMVLLIFFISFSLVIIGFLWKLSYGKSRERINRLQLEALAREKSLLSEKLEAEKQLTHLKEKTISDQKNDLQIKNEENERLNQQLRQMLLNTSLDADQPDNKLEMNGDYWKDVVLKFQVLNPDFVNKLKSYSQDLTKGDIEFCTMARMNLSNKEIASLLNISLESVRTKKYRLLKKLYLPESLDFYSWILTL